MRKYVGIGLIAMVAFGLTLNSCKKSDEEDDGDELQEMSSDESMHSTEMELVMNDINSAAQSSGLGKTDPIPGATVNDSSFIGDKKIVITYNGKSADGLRSRSGSVTIRLVSGDKWADAGSVIHITYLNLTVSRNNKTVSFEGDFYVRNVSGGKAFINPSVIHKAWGSGKVGFENGMVKVWNINRKRTFMNTSGVLSIKTEGDTSVNGNDKVLTWGTNRKGKDFYTIVSSPVVFSSACPGKPMSGVKIHKGLAREISVTFGCDSKGDVITSGCPTHFKVEWKNAKGESKSAVLPY